MEDQFLHDRYFKEPKKLADDIINPLFGRIPEDLTKRHIFYEFILVDTDSIYTSDVFDKIDNEKLIFRKIKICKIITLEQWGGDPNSTRNFSRIFHVSEFSYWDYRDALTKFFYGQNPGNSLSWFLYFDKNFLIDLPFWFLEWWDKFGPIIDLLPTPVKESFSLRTSTINKPDSWAFYPDLFLFFVQFNLTWILMLEYSIQEKLIDNVNVPYFGRQVKIKWWSDMNLANLGKEKVTKWLSDNPIFCVKETDQSSFLMAKSQNQAIIAAAPSPDELMKIAEEMRNTMANMSQAGSENSIDNEGTDGDPFDSGDPSTYFGHDP
ncbi:hypothetical protein Ddye_017629 [Dipteronia dyeriana]|uniref:Uncharacterized protein n=1 Tax=Dipteronia dyeriana TaxID=168575 RepID=A0AAD9UA15_9ROSI|nr:hypothetical protein Ddye_017629 [Dipteronia dyeriana]